MSLMGIRALPCDVWYVWGRNKTANMLSRYSWRVAVSANLISCIRLGSRGVVAHANWHEGRPPPSSATSRAWRSASTSYAQSESQPMSNSKSCPGRDPRWAEEENEFTCRWEEKMAASHVTPPSISRSRITEHRNISRENRSDFPLPTNHGVTSPALTIIWSLDQEKRRGRNFVWENSLDTVEHQPN